MDEFPDRCLGYTLRDAHQHERPQGDPRKYVLQITGLTGGTKTHYATEADIRALHQLTGRMIEGFEELAKP